MKLIVSKRSDHHWAPVRAERDRLLALTDAYLTGDRLDETQTETLKTYRARLRDLPQSQVSAADVVWPDLPPFVKDPTGPSRV
ncbi:phage tail assembly chaperone [Brevundimonas sp. Bb-A]|uniref:phage tail assembly chaperone n=1 Tax=Brevundimonas sp. Bb-A TaxID=2560058 RepID=UPI0012AA331B|nr:phage tail assembly chaperone [Brevundimonas sp. Bb-A]QFU30266.1 hypothetical protein BSP_01185 [Brevundimonas sp. Bb-A]